MSSKQKVVSYTPPHEINEVDIRNRSAINSAIDADKRYIKFLFALLDDVPADIRSMYNVKYGELKFTDLKVCCV